LIAQPETVRRRRESQEIRRNSMNIRGIGLEIMGVDPLEGP
jgi:hypothetical protein